MAEDGEDRTIRVKTGGSNVGLIIGGIAVIAVAGAVGWYFYTGYQKREQILRLVEQYKLCIDEQIANGMTAEQAKTYCDGIYLPIIDPLVDDLNHGFFDFVPGTLAGIAAIFGIYYIGKLSVIAIKWARDAWYLKHRGGGSGGGTPTDPFHNYENGSNHPTQQVFEDACLVSYGTPNYANENWPYLWANVNALPNAEKQMFAGYLSTQGVADPLTNLNQAWASLPVEQQMLIAGLIIAGTLLVCTVSLGTATPVMLPIAASAIAMV